MKKNCNEILKEKCLGSSKKQSRKQKKMTTPLERSEKCPLCLEILELDDLNFFPCTCGYQVCRFCWHRIRTNENCLCPACRRQYPEDPVTFKPLTQEELQKVKSEKKMKEMQKKKEIAESRKQLANIRVVQKNLVYVHGLPLGIDADEDRYRRIVNIFKDYGPVAKCIVNNKTNYAGSQSHRASAYVTYQKIDDALKAFKSLPNLKIEGLEIKTSLGTTKYCSNFLKNVHCPKQDCMYLHEMADEELCFTKEQIHAGEHLICGNMLFERMVEHLQQKANQLSQSKEPPTIEQEIELEKPSPEKVKLRDDSSDSSEESNKSPVQSKLQHMFAFGEAQSSALRADFESRFSSNFSSNSPSETARSIASNNVPHLQLSLSSEGSTVNSVHSPVNSVQNHVKNYQNFPTPPPKKFEDFYNGEPWNEQRVSSVIGQSSRHQNHHLQQNGLSKDFNFTSSGGTTSSILSRIPIYNSNGTSNSMTQACNFEPIDAELGFDPCQISLKGLEELLISEANDNRIDPNTVRINSSVDLQRRIVQQNQSMLQMQQSVRPAPQLQRQRNPPPGFSVNTYPSNPPLSSPVFESRNPLPSRTAPVLNISNSFNGIRQNCAPTRFQQSGISLNTNSLANGFSPQNLRSFPPQTLQDLMPRSTMNGQPMQNQRFDNLSQLPLQPPLQLPQQHHHQQQQHTLVDQSNLSPSFWNNMSQSQWMSAENCYQNQGMPECRSASPQCVRRLQQLRSTDVNRQIQQLAATKYSNFSTFSDNPQYMMPNNQHNQLTKGVHTFP